MKKITMFEAEDGKLFRNELDCINYENLIRNIKEISDRLPQLPKDANCNFSNGEGYLQHDADIVNKAIIDLVKLEECLEKYLDDHNFLEHPFTYRNSIIGRIIDDSDSPIKSLWYRFMCMDETYKEYGQGYYAANPSYSTGGCLNQ